MLNCYNLMQGTFENLLVNQKKNSVKCLLEMSKEKGQSKNELTGYFLQENKANNLILIFAINYHCIVDVTMHIKIRSLPVWQTLLQQTIPLKLKKKPPKFVFMFLTDKILYRCILYFYSS